MVKFSVRSSNYAGGGSVNLKWTDFPTENAVKKVTGKYEEYLRDYATGEILLGANYFIFTEMNLSDDLKEKALKEVPEDVPEFDKHFWITRALDEMYYEGQP